LFSWKEAKKMFFEKKKSKWHTQTEIFKIANSQYFFSKFLWIGPWVGTID
jgi:hypothetical protein